MDVCNFANKGTYKLKMNGFHLVGSRYVIEKPHSGSKRDRYSEYFNIAYEKSLNLELKGEEQVDFINSEMIFLYRKEYNFKNLFEILELEKDFKDYIRKRLNQKIHNVYLRKKRFNEKANLHIWNYFVTQTYDSSLFNTEEEFVKAYLTCLSHLSTDFGWRYMLVPERGKVSGRLHFHGIFYIPNGSMKGFFKESKYFSPYNHKMEKSMINSFFALRFGRNDFQLISKNNSVSGVSSYISKYIGKTDAKIIYSRHIDSFVEIELSSDDISMSFESKFCKRYIVFDDITLNTVLDLRYRRGEVLRRCI